MIKFSMDLYIRVTDKNIKLIDKSENLSFIAVASVNIFLIILLENIDLNYMRSVYLFYFLSVIKIILCRLYVIRRCFFLLRLFFLILLSIKRERVRFKFLVKSRKTRKYDYYLDNFIIYKQNPATENFLVFYEQFSYNSSFCNFT